MNFHALIQTMCSMIISILIYVSSKTIRRLWTFYQQSEQTKVYFHPPISLSRILTDILIAVICLAISCEILFIVFQIPLLQIFIYVFGFLFINIILIRKCRAETAVFMHNNYFDIGHGAALCYYYSYLNLFVPDILNQRIEQFKSDHNVDVRPKLFILFPKSGNVPKYIDNVETHIERCDELPEFRIDHAGVRNRTFNITVYHIRRNEEDSGIRCAIEYAQPLKAIMAFKNKNDVSDSELLRQIHVFFNALKELLRDENESYKYCELILFDDESENIHDVILQRNSVSSFQAGIGFI